MLLFVLLYGIEATLRKYIIATPLLIGLKYIPLFWSIRRRYLGLAFFVLSTCSLLLLTTASSSLTGVLYDLLGLILVPFVLYLLASRSELVVGQSVPIVKASALLGSLNALLIIWQFFAGPNHFISQTVDQSFSQHVYGVGGLFQKAPGIAAVSSPFISVAGLIALEKLRKPNINKLKKYSFILLQSIIGVSPFFNLPSRTYFLGVYLFFAFRLLAFLFSRRSLLARLKLLSPLIAGLLTIAATVSIFYWNEAIELFSADRVFSDFGSVVSRLLNDYYPLSQLDLDLPLLGGAGLGSLVGSNYWELASFPQCFGVWREFEAPRLVCQFGWFGLMLILSRLFIALVFVIKARQFFKGKSYVSACGFSYVALQLLLMLQLGVNDYAAGLILVAIISSAPEGIGIIKSRQA